MSASLKSGFQAVYGSSPKELYNIESQFKDFQEKLGQAYGTNLKSSFKTWSDDDLQNCFGAKWTPAGQTELARLSEVWICSLVDKEHLHRLPELTAYLALHYPQIDDSWKPALALLEKTYDTGATHRPGLSDCHLSDAALGVLPTFAKYTTSPDYVRFRAWYDDLSVTQRVVFACFLALCFVQLCNKTTEEVLTFMQNHAMHKFQAYWGVPANNLMWIPPRSISYLKSYFKPCSQLVVTVLRPFLHLREQLTKTSTHLSLLDSLDYVLFSPTKGRGLELVQLFTNVVAKFDLSEDQLLYELPSENSPTCKRLEEFIQRYGTAESGTWYWAQYFGKEYFADLCSQQNRKVALLFACLVDEGNVDDLDSSDKRWVDNLLSKYWTRRERVSFSCYEGFWDGPRRLDYA